MARLEVVPWSMARINGGSKVISRLGMVSTLFSLTRC
jgi:hypothetical protein